MRLAIVLSLVGVSAVSFADPGYTPPDTPFKLRFDIDAPLLVTGLVIWTTPYNFVQNEVPGPPCDPCDRSNVNWLDRQFIDWHDTTTRTIAQYWMFGTVPIWLGIEFADVGFHKWRAFFTDFVVLAESVAWDGAIAEVFRRAVRRPRPYMYTAGIYPSDRNIAEADFSYYSGHTAALFAFGFTTAYTYTLRHPGSKWTPWVWVGLILYGLAEGAMRIIGGDHFLSDVAAGVAIGSGVGLLVPALHRVNLEVPGVKEVSLMPTHNSADGSTFFTVSGRF